MCASVNRYDILCELSSEARNYFFPGLNIQDEDVLSFSECKSASAKGRSRRLFRMRSLPRMASPFPSYGNRAMDEMEMLIIPEASPAGEKDSDECDKDRIAAFMAEIAAIQEKYGISIEQLEALLSYKVKLSHLMITGDKRIILTDFDYQEVKMEKLAKIVFLLYLRHPEGIRYKDLIDHRSELEELYLSISDRSDLDAMKKSIDCLVDTVTNNSINEKVSKAKKAFRNVIDDRIARFYYIEGKQGEAKCIALDRSLVIWE